MFYFIPEKVRIEIGFDEATLKLLRDALAQTELAGKLDNLAKRLASSNKGLDAVIAATPDPDLTD